MIVVVGLGNQGEEYSDTRHNAGFIVVDKLAEELCANYWKIECGAKTAHVGEYILVKPQSFMNLSGSPVKNILDKYEIDELIVVHDDMDILGGNIRIKRGGGNAGHNGLKSIDQKLGTNDYIRVRVGIDHAPGRMPFADYVLASPKGKAKEDFEAACTRAADAVLYLGEHTLEQAQQEFNSTVQ